MGSKPSRFLSFRTKPRSPQKTVEWLEYFAQLEGQNYNKSYKSEKRW
jgi:hypothetical protein